MSEAPWLTKSLQRAGERVAAEGERTTARVQRAQAASTNPLDELGHALTVVLLPPLGVAVAGMLRLSVGWQIAAVALLAVGIGVLLAREGRSWDAVWDALKGKTFWIPFGMIGLGLLIALPIVPYGSVASAVVWAGFLAWFGTLLLRLVGYATALLRIVFIVLATIAWAASFLALFVLERGVATWLLGVLWLLALLSLGVVVYNEHGRPPGEGRIPGQDNPGTPGATMLTIRQWGLSFSLAATFAFVGASILSAATGPQPTDKEHRLKFTTGQDVNVASIRGLDDAELAKQFSPVLEFSDQQRWKPAAVNDFLANSSLYWTNGTRIVPKGAVTAHDLTRECPRGVTAPCYELRLGCSAGNSDDAKVNCSMAAHLESGVQAGGHAYVRVLESKNRKGYPLRPAPPPPFGTNVHKVLQYWLFYPYDDWHARTLYGDLRQSHEGDWEAVTIGFSQDAPLFVAYSSHCGGTWRDWADVRLARSGGPVRRGTHPVVGVAEGSQANYPEPEVERAPNWAPCAGIPSDKASAATFAYNVRDQTGESLALTIPDDQLEVVDETSGVMGFPGYWGTNAHATFMTKLGKEYVLQRAGRGPAGPAFQPLWAEPLERVFCAATWHYDGERSFEDCRAQRARLERKRERRK